MHSIKTYMTIFVMILVQVASAEQVIPIFSGYWYTQAQDSISGNHLTACLKSEYQYENHLLGTAEQVTTSLLSSPPTRTNCNWESSNIFGSETAFTPDFIFRNQKTLSE